MADADGATTFSELDKLENAAHQGYDVVVGSRNHLKEDSIAKVEVCSSFHPRELGTVQC